jgi:hypothetical protein
MTSAADLLADTAASRATVVAATTLIVVACVVLIFAIGAIRFLAGTEALTGFVLVTWSASFTFVEMQRFWRN